MSSTPPHSEIRIPKSAIKRPISNYTFNPDVMDSIWLERVRQKALLKHGDIKFDCASPIVSNDRKLRVQAEEHGEVAEAIDLLEDAPDAKRKAALGHLYLELIQSAAVTIAWLESVHEEMNR